MNENNLSDTPNPVGRPFQYQDSDEFQAVVDQYFIECDNAIINKQVVQKGEIVLVPTPTPYTIIGLARRLDLSRQALNEYRVTDKFGDILTHARAKIEEHNLTRALVGCYDSKIATLNLASNYGYADRQDHSLLVETYESRLARITAEKQAQLPGPKEVKVS